MQLGKLAARGRLNAVAPGPLVHIEDQLSKRRFLVDTGASFSIFPHKSSTPPSGPALFGPAGKIIPCWGEKYLVLSFNGRQFHWTFLLAAVSFPILGVDFLRHYRLLVDPAANRLVDQTNIESIATVPCLSAPAAGAVSSAPSPPQSPASSPSSRSSAAVPRPPSAAGVKVPYGSPVAALQADNGSSGSLLQRLERIFPEVFNSSQVLPPATHGVEHHLVTSGPPIASKFRRLDGEKLAAARAEFAKMERDRIVQRSTSPWSSPLYMVQKPDGSWRPCGDFRRLNLVTEPDTYPLPNMLAFLHEWRAALFSARWICARDIIKSPCIILTYPKRRWQPPLGC